MFGTSPHLLSHLQQGNEWIHSNIVNKDMHTREAVLFSCLNCSNVKFFLVPKI